MCVAHCIDANCVPWRAPLALPVALTHTPSPSPLLQHTKGEFWCLANCRAATSSAIEYDLPGCFNSALPNDATCHITVFYKSGAAKANVAEYCA